jgi:hypothetical protein
MDKKPNRGWFKAGADRRRHPGFCRGPDPRRHELTIEERSRGGRRSSRRGLVQWAKEQLGHSQGFSDDPF